MPKFCQWSDMLLVEEGCRCTSRVKSFGSCQIYLVLQGSFEVLWEKASRMVNRIQIPTIPRGQPFVSDFSVRSW